MKVCTKCHIEKDLSKFYADKSKSDGHKPRCKSCENEYARLNRQNPKYIYKFNKYQKEWQKTYRRTTKYKEWRKLAFEKLSKTRQELKKQIVEHYGGKCNCCPVNEICFLSIDHVNNDGYKLREHRKRRNYDIRYYRKIISDNYPKDLQILCYNCNMAKNHNGGICPHKTLSNQ